LSENGIIDN